MPRPSGPRARPAPARPARDLGRDPRRGRGQAHAVEPAQDPPPAGGTAAGPLSGRARAGVRHRGDGGRRGARRRRRPRRRSPTSGARFVEQPEPRGTGDALRRARPEVPDTATELLLLYGDVPLLAGPTLAALLGASSGGARGRHPPDVRAERSDRLRARPPRPGRPGPRHRRGARRDAGRAARSRVQLGDLLLRPAPPLAGARGRRPARARQRAGRGVPDGRDRAAGAAREPDRGRARARIRARSPASTTDGSSRRSRTLLRSRTLDALMTAGVTIVDPAATYVDTTVTVGRDTVLHPGVRLAGRTVIGEGCVIGTGSQLTDTTLGDRVTLRPYCVLDDVPGGGRRDAGPVCAPAPRVADRARGGDRQLHRDQAGHDRAPGEGAPRRVHRRRHGGRGRQHRRRRR